LLNKFKSILNNPWTERGLFFLLLALLLYPVYSFKYFVSHDGAAHLYNANILIDLLFKNEFYPQFFQLNPEPEPNLLGHALYVLTRLLFNPVLSDKIIITLALTFFVLSFRYLVYSITKERNLLYLLMFLFAYNYIFVLGFLNFIISISVLFFTSGWFFKHQYDFRYKKFIALFLLSLALYFSHIFSYLIWLVIAASLSVQYLLSKNSWQDKIKYLEILFWSNIIPLLFIYNYFTKKKSSDIVYWSLKEKIKYLYELKPILNFNPDVLNPYFILIKILFIGGAVFVLIKIAMSFKEKMSQLWVYLLFFFVFILYLILPNTSSGGGYISDRFALYLLLITILIFTMQELKNIIQYVIALLVIIISIQIIRQAKYSYNQMDIDAKELMMCESRIKEGAVVLPVVFQQHWLYGHVSNYLGANKRMVLLENYEASQGYFPVLWKDKTLPIVNLPLIFNQHTYLDFNGYQNRSGLKVNYVLLWDNIKQYDKPEYGALLSVLNEKYKIVYNNTNETVRLYELK
jgi:hypothetical protein